MSVSERGPSEPVSRVPRRPPLTVRFSPDFVSGLRGVLHTEQATNKAQSGTLGFLFGSLDDDVVTVNTCKLLPDEASKVNLSQRGFQPDVPMGAFLATFREGLPFATAHLIGWCRIGTNSGLLESDFSFHNQCFRRASDIAVLLRPETSTGVSAEIYAKVLKTKLSNENCSHRTVQFPGISAPSIALEADLRRPIDTSIYLRAYEATDAFDTPKSSFSTLATFAKSVLKFGRSGEDVFPTISEPTKEAVIPDVRAPTAAWTPPRSVSPVLSEPAQLQKLEVLPDSSKRNTLMWAVPSGIAAGVLLGIILGVNIRPGGSLEVRPARAYEKPGSAVTQAQSHSPGNRATLEGSVAQVTPKPKILPSAYSEATGWPVADRSIVKPNVKVRAMPTAGEKTKQKALAPLGVIPEKPAPEVQTSRTVAKPYTSATVSRISTLERSALSQPSQGQLSPKPAIAPANAVPATSSQAEPMPKAETAPPQVSRPLAIPARAPALTGEIYSPARPLRQVMPPTNGSGLMIFKAITVEIQATVDAQGRVTATLPIQGQEKVSQSIIGAAIKAAQGWRFQPAILHGQPVESKYTIAFRFLPRDR